MCCFSIYIFFFSVHPIENERMVAGSRYEQMMARYRHNPQWLPAHPGLGKLPIEIIYFFFHIVIHVSIFSF